jgi:hypothetical protein
MKIEFKEVSKEEYSFTIDGDEIGTVERSIDQFGIDNWTAIEHLEGLSHEGKTKKEAIKSLYNKILENTQTKEI